MKMRLLLVTVLVGMALTGCAAGPVGQGMQSAGNSLGQSMTSASNMQANPLLTSEEAQQIALKHAGLTAGQVAALHADYEIEHGTPIYDVEFHHRAWQFDYEIHADTGEILSFSKEA